ncbi:MAG TPA: hypothetical protein VLF89_04185 [Candidatus Saccharimonadales bacterium]|nr:hypothetical protein [Candidatus Saccharimonadales bacterium]
MSNFNKPIKPQSNDSYNINFFPQSNVIANTLDEMFPEQKHEDKLFKKAKEIVGNAYNNEELRSMITSFEYLITNWMEEYEKKVFDNKTLKELLQNI